LARGVLLDGNFLARFLDALRAAPSSKASSSADVWTLSRSRTPVAPPCRHDRSFEKAAKNRGRPFLGFGRRACGLRGRPTCRLTFNSPQLTLYSPALRVSAGKSGVGEGECQVSWMQISVRFSCQALRAKVLAEGFRRIPGTGV